MRSVTTSGDETMAPRSGGSNVQTTRGCSRPATCRALPVFDLPAEESACWNKRGSVCVGSRNASAAAVTRMMAVHKQMRRLMSSGDLVTRSLFTGRGVNDYILAKTPRRRTATLGLVVVQFDKLYHYPGVSHDALRTRVVGGTRRRRTLVTLLNSHGLVANLDTASDIQENAIYQGAADELLAGDKD